MINRLVAPDSRLSAAERHALEPLRSQYHATHDMFTPEEVARLRFLRWLVHSSRWDESLDCLAQKMTWTPGSIA